MSKSACFSLVILFALGPALAVGAEPPQFNVLSTSDGLSQGSVNSIHQDSRGFMWFGTQDGLNRYDGYSFVIFKYDPEDLQSLSNNYVLAISEQSDGTLWIGTNGGLNRYHRRHSTFTRYLHDPDAPRSLSDNFVRVVFEDRSGALWIGTRNGLNRFDPLLNHFDHFLHEPGAGTIPRRCDVWSLVQDENGTLWIGTLGGLFRFDPAGGEPAAVPLAHPALSGEQAPAVRCLRLDAGGRLWLGTDQGLGIHHPGGGDLRWYVHDPDNPASLSNDNVYAIFGNDRGPVWIGTWGGGLNRFDPQEETFAVFRHNARQPDSLSNDIVYTIMEDRGGLMWLGTFAGISTYYDRPRKFVHHHHHSGQPHSLNHNMVFALFEDSDRFIWIGTYGGGLNRFDRRSGRFTVYRHDPENPASLSNDEVLAIAQDPEGDLWIGTHRGGLNRLDRRRGTFTRYVNDPADNSSLSYNDVRVLRVHPDGRLWIGTWGGGLNCFDPRQRRFIRYTRDPDAPDNSLSGNYVYSLHLDPDGTLWIGTVGSGLNRFHPDEGRFTHFRHDPRNPRSLSHDDIFAIHRDRQGTLWIGTNGSGLDRFDPQTGHFDHLTEKDGLPNNVVYGIEEDGQGRLWLSTNHGLARFDPERNVFRNYDVSDGLQDNEFNGNASFRSPRTGEMLFGGVNGFNIFHPSRVLDDPYVPPVVISRLQHYSPDLENGIEVDLGINELDHLDMNYKNHLLLFEFAALSYHHVRRNQYAYKLEGFNDHWIRLGERRDVMFTGLEPGEYVLHVRGSNGDGTWNEQGTSLALTVHPPWTRTTWAYWSYFLGIVGLLYGVRRVELYLRRQRTEQKRQAAELEEARRLQLSMLPRELPRPPHLDIAVHMSTATEIGGDYYDFIARDDGSLTIALGDATGHGMKAGSMVSIAKVLFNMPAATRDLREFLVQSNTTIRKIRMDNLMMAFAILRIDAGQLTLANAGMPPVYIYRGDSGQVEEVLVCGMPLGAMDVFPYETRRVPLRSGDVLLLLSDGLAEQRNGEGAPFTYARVSECFRQVAGQPPERIIEALLQQVRWWRADEEQEDDMTLLIIRCHPADGQIPQI